MFIFLIKSKDLPYKISLNLITYKLFLRKYSKESVQNVFEVIGRPSIYLNLQ